MPADYAAFERYCDRTLDEVLVAHPTAKYGVGYVTKGFPCPKGVPSAVWRIVAAVFNPVAAFLTTSGLPPRARTLATPEADSVTTAILDAAVAEFEQHGFRRVALDTSGAAQE